MQDILKLVEEQNKEGSTECKQTLVESVPLNACMTTHFLYPRSDCDVINYSVFCCHF